MNKENPKKLSVGECGKIVKYAFLEVVIIFFVTAFPAVCVGVFGCFRQGGGGYFAAYINGIFQHGECMVLAASLLGTAFVNMMDVGNETMNRWLSFRKMLWLFLPTLYAIVIVGDCSMMSIDSPKEGGTLAHLQVAFLVASWVLLFCACLSRRVNGAVVEEEPSPNLFQNDDNQFAAKFNEYLNQ